MNPSTPASAPAVTIPAAPRAAAASPREEPRPACTPLTPARVGESIGDEANVELDVAPNLGGEQQMQDA